MPRELHTLVESLAHLTTCCASCEHGGPCEGKVKPLRRANVRPARTKPARFAKIHPARLSR